MTFILGFICGIASAIALVFLIAWHGMEDDEKNHFFEDNKPNL